MTNLTLPIFTDAEKARAHLEALLWPAGTPICPHCGVEGESTLVKGKSHRPGMYMCNACRKPFSVTVGTVMEKSHIPLNKWVLGFHLMASSKKGISAHQMHRQLGITYKAAWFMAHRIREAMAPAEGTPPLGGEGKTLEADETYLGPKAGRKLGRPPVARQTAVFALVERGGAVRSVHIPNVRGETLRAAVAANSDRKSDFVTDELQAYTYIGWNFNSHNTVTHSKNEYVRDGVHTNTIEGYFSILKRGLDGVYQHVSPQHLPRYLVEFDFRYSNRAKLGINDTVRTDLAIKGATGKRLTYHTVSG